MLKVLKKWFDFEKKELKRYQSIVQQIREMEKKYESLVDDELKNKNISFKRRLKNGETLDQLLVEAFAAVVEGAKRVLGMRHFDVQLIGGMALHDGRVAEMKTGEGKTLAATLPVYLNALTGEGVHIITANEYLAGRDFELTGPLYEFLGLTVGLNLNGMSREQKKQAYQADIVFGTSSEFGFDYLRDHMVKSKDHIVQKRLNFALIDEVDSILIDEARTPLIISGSKEQDNILYHISAKFVKGLKKGIDFIVEEDEYDTVFLTDVGIAKAEKVFQVSNLYAPEHAQLNHHIHQALRAEYIMKKDVDYVVIDGKVEIVSANTGRVMKGRRFNEGLHQAIEAKEGVKIKSESVTHATITLQNYFRLYKKIAGMTGTAKTEEEEFRSIYGMDVITVPTNKPVQRVDLPDFIYPTLKAKYQAVVAKICELHVKGQPVLIGTTSIQQSEQLSLLLAEQGIQHQVLNAKNHKQEAEIIAKAGEIGAVTIATNMAGRGTDIKISEQVRKLGGLYVIGTERHDSRRIDNQLRGRSGRQGDPGTTQFYVSLEDNFLKKFDSDRFKELKGKFQDDQPIENRWVTKAIEDAQLAIEANHYYMRKRLLEYDNVMDQQRTVIYTLRKQILDEASMNRMIEDYISNVVTQIVSECCSDQMIPEEWNLSKLEQSLLFYFDQEKPFDLHEAVKRDQSPKRLVETIKQDKIQFYREKKCVYPGDWEQKEKKIFLDMLDRFWMEQIESLLELRQGIHFQSYASKRPETEYEFMAYEMFLKMMDDIQKGVIRSIFMHLTKLK